MLMTIASTLIKSQCASTTGRADGTHVRLDRAYVYLSSVLTNTHCHHEACYESPQLHDTARSTVHEVILVLRFAAYPVRYWREHIGRYNEKRIVSVEESGGEDDKYEADGEDLLRPSCQCIWSDGPFSMTYKREDYDRLDASHCDSCSRCETGLLRSSNSRCTSFNAADLVASEYW